MQLTFEGVFRGNAGGRVSVWITVFLSLVHIGSIADMIEATSGSRPLNDVLHLYTCCSYLLSVWLFAHEHSAFHYCLVLGSYSGFANTRIIVGLLKHLPLLLLQVLFAVLLGLTSQGHRFLMLDALLSAYLLAVALPVAKKKSGSNKGLFDVANILAIRFVFSHPMFGELRQAHSCVIVFALLIQKLMDGKLVRKTHMPPLTRGIGDMAKFYYSAFIPTVKKFRTLGSPLRESLNLSTVPAARSKDRRATTGENAGTPVLLGSTSSKQGPK